ELLPELGEPFSHRPIGRGARIEGVILGSQRDEVCHFAPHLFGQLFDHLIVHKPPPITSQGQVDNKRSTCPNDLFNQDGNRTRRPVLSGATLGGLAERKLPTGGGGSLRRLAIHACLWLRLGLRQGAVGHRSRTRN